MEIIKTDILIVGAGPAGCSVARDIKDKDIIVIDKSTFPRDKPCSGLLVEESKEVLERLKIPKSVFGVPPELDLEHIDLDNNLNVLQKKGLGNTDRIKLDEWLFKLINKKVEFYQNTHITEIKDNGQRVVVKIITETGEKVVEAKKLVGADGSTSTIRRLLKVKPVTRYKTAQNFIKTNKKINTCKFIYWNELTDWYSWLLPKEEGIIEIGGAFHLNVDREVVLNKLMKKMGVDGEIIKRANWLISRPKSIDEICLGNGKNIFLVGEAAGFISASTGEGISFGLRSGTFLSQILNFDSDINKKYKEVIKTLIDEVKNKIKKSEMLNDEKSREYLLKELGN